MPFACIKYNSPNICNFFSRLKTKQKKPSSLQTQLHPWMNFPKPFVKTRFFLSCWLLLSMEMQVPISQLHCSRQDQENINSSYQSTSLSCTNFSVQSCILQLLIDHCIGYVSVKANFFSLYSSVEEKQLTSSDVLEIYLLN